MKNPPTAPQHPYAVEIPHYTDCQQFPYLNLTGHRVVLSNHLHQGARHIVHVKDRRVRVQARGVELVAVLLGQIHAVWCVSIKGSRRLHVIPHGYAYLLVW